MLQLPSASVSFLSPFSLVLYRECWTLLEGFSFYPSSCVVWVGLYKGLGSHDVIRAFLHNDVKKDLAA